MILINRELFVVVNEGWYISAKLISPCLNELGGEIGTQESYSKPQQ